MFIYGTCWPERPYQEKLCLTPQAEGDTKDQGDIFSNKWTNQHGGDTCCENTRLSACDPTAYITH